MKATVFYNETTLNGKFQIMTKSELTGRGIKKYGSNCIMTQKGITYKGLNNYWVTALALEEIKKNEKTERACF